MAYLCAYKTIGELCSAACANQGSSGMSGCMLSCNTQATLQTVLDNCSVYTPSFVVDTVFVNVPSDTLCASGEFDWDKAKQGFVDSWDFVIVVFACFVIIKLLRMI